MALSSIILSEMQGEKVKMTAKKRLIVFGILLTISLSLIITASLYARPEFGEDCLSCHTAGGITVTSNVTVAVEVRTSSSFGLQVEAEGDAQALTMIWSAVASNPSFAFMPSKVTDNDPNDNDPTINKVKGNFKITAPATQGEYTIQVFAAGSGGKGGTMTFQVTVTTEGPPTENLLPTAYFLHTRRGMTIEFEDRSWDPDGNITSWHWNFGDNTNSTEQNPTHTFAETGTYTVTLTVTDDEGGSNIQSQTFMVPSKKELLQLWALQVSIGSIMIVFTTLFSIGIATSRKRKGTQSTPSTEGRKVE